MSKRQPRKPHLSLGLWPVFLGPLLINAGWAISAPGGSNTGTVATAKVLRPLIDMPEGIAIDHRGNIFVGNRRLENALRVAEVLQIRPDGTTWVYATLDPGVVDAFDRGVAGLAIDSTGDVYAALASYKPATHGVWRLRRDEAPERLAGSDQIVLPNALAFDPRGNLYVTDSVGGAVWRFPPGKPGAIWVHHDLLAPDPNFGVGANGIAFMPPNILYVANTDFALIARIPIRSNGDAGEPEVIASGFELLTIDGLAADTHGDLHAVIAGAAIFGTAPLVRVNPVTGAVTASTAEWEKFDFPTSLAFGSGTLGRKNMYVINAGLFPEGRPGAAPGIIRVRIGVPGFPTR
jgi:sugar lactone lactonase YvrE